MRALCGYGIVAVGILFNVIGCVGLIRFPDLYNRLQAATKGVVFGTSLIMCGIFVITGFSETGVKALLTIAFLLLTAPVASHAIARGARIFGVEMAPGTIVCDECHEEKKDGPGGTGG